MVEGSSRERDGWIEMQIQIIQTNRKTISLEVTKDAQVIVRAPRSMSTAEIQSFVESKSEWIEKHRKEAEKRLATRNEQERISLQKVKELAEQAKEYIPQRVDHYAEIIGVTYGRITIRNQRTRWGSCSGKGNLNFNCLLMMMPKEIIDYVIVHELCHRKEMNHSTAFWKEVENVLPDYREYRMWLKENGGSFIERMG